MSVVNTRLSRVVEGQEYNIIHIPCTKVVIPVRIRELEALQVWEEGTRLLCKVGEDT